MFVPSSIRPPSRSLCSRPLPQGKDKRIEELTAACEQAKAAAAAGGSAAAAVPPASELQATVDALQRKLLSAEEGCNQRLAAETELLNDRIAGLGKQLA